MNQRHGDEAAALEGSLRGKVIGANERAGNLRAAFVPQFSHTVDQALRDAPAPPSRMHTEQIKLPAKHAVGRDGREGIDEADQVARIGSIRRSCDERGMVRFETDSGNPHGIKVMMCPDRTDQAREFGRIVGIHLPHTNHSEKMTKSRNLYLYLAVFTSGMTSLAVEMGASRLLGSVFGTSNLVWANVIGLMLLYLTVGYFVGGRWADRSPYPQTLYRILLWGAFLSGLIPLIARPLLHGAANAVINIDAGVVLGSFASVLVLFALPVTLLGMVSPFAIRIAMTDVSDAGRTSGRIYAISTIGSIIGTFLPVLVLIPELGTIRTFLVFAAILFVIGLIGLWREQGARALIYLWMPAAVVVIALIVLNGTPLRSPLAGATLLFEDETPYNYVQVQEDGAGNRYLFLNEGEGVHSQWNKDVYEYHRTWDFFLAAPYFNAPPYTPSDVQSLAIVGLAAGTIARQYTHVYGDIPIDGIEIDPGIVEAGNAYFEMGTMPNLSVYVEDGRYMLNKLDKQYTVVGIDAYRPPYIPWHLTTIQFFEEVRDHLTSDGAVVINVGRTSTDRRLIDALTATLLQVFPSVHAMDVPQSFNTILVATVQPTSDSNLAANLAALPADATPMLRDTLALGVQTLVPAEASSLVFTDDRAPVESLVDSLVLNFLLSDDLDQLRPES